MLINLFETEYFLDDFVYFELGQVVGDVGGFLFSTKNVLETWDFLQPRRQTLSTNWVRVLFEEDTFENSVLTGVEDFAQFTDKGEFLIFMFILCELENGMCTDSLPEFEFIFGFLFDGFDKGF